MPETITKGKWEWEDVAKDLKIQGDFKGVKVYYPDSKGLFFQTERGTKFSISWKKDVFLKVTIAQEEEERELIDAFAKVIGYRPFCQYINLDRFDVFEWRKNGQEERFRELKKASKESREDGSLFELRRID